MCSVKSRCDFDVVLLVLECNNTMANEEVEHNTPVAGVKSPLLKAAFNCSILCKVISSASLSPGLGMTSCGSFIS